MSTSLSVFVIIISGLHLRVLREYLTELFKLLRLSLVLKSTLFLMICLMKSFCKEDKALNIKSLSIGAIIFGTPVFILIEK